MLLCLFFFNDTATTEIYTLSLHDALPISAVAGDARLRRDADDAGAGVEDVAVEQRLRDVQLRLQVHGHDRVPARSEEHTSELQSRQYIVCRLLLEKKKINKPTHTQTKL